MEYTIEEKVLMHDRLSRELINRVADTGWINLGLSGANVIWSSGTAKIRRIGNIVNLIIYNIRSSNVIDGRKIVINGLPEDCVPAITLIVPCIATPSKGDMDGGYLTIGTDGKVYITPLAGTSYIPSYGIHAHAVYFAVGGGYYLKVVFARLYTRLGGVVHE